MWSRNNLSWQQAALLFGVCGAASSRMMDLGDWGSYALPIPFGMLAAWICVRSIGPGIALVVLDALVWQAALKLAVGYGTDGPTLQRVAALYLAGLVGGLGVGLAAALCQRRVPEIRSLGIAALAGGVCGLPFAWWVISGNEVPIAEWAYTTLCFSIWQAAVGVCLWYGFRQEKSGLKA